MNTHSTHLTVAAILLVVASACPTKLLAQVGPATDTAEQSARGALPIAEPKSHNATNRDGVHKENGVSFTAVFGSLLLVLGVFLALVWVLRRASPQGAALLPPEAFEVLGRAPLANRQQAHLLRCGNKLLLVSASTTGTEPLTEITDPAEVERLTELCRRAKPTIATTALGRILGQKG